MSNPVVHNEPSRAIIQEMPTMHRRFSKDQWAIEPLTYEFTDDPALLHQYYRIREIMYRKVHNVDQFSGDEDEYDKISHIAVARRGKLVVGGCRLITREADEDFLLPMESEDFKLRDLFPELPASGLQHGEISRFAVLDTDEEHMQIMLTMGMLTMEKCFKEGLGYVFIKTPGLLVARHWRKLLATVAHQRSVEICRNVIIPEDPEYPEIKWQLVRTELNAADFPTPKKSAPKKAVLDHFS